MDGRLWTRLYRQIRRVGKSLRVRARKGRPRVYGTEEVLAVWAFAALMDWPISVAQRRLAAQLVAPLNLRGAKSDTWRARQPGRDASERLLATPQGAALLKEHSAVERSNSWFKGNSHVSMLPYHVRRLHRVRRWIDLKLAVFFVHQYLLQKDLTTAA